MVNHILLCSSIVNGGLIIGIIYRTGCTNTPHIYITTYTGIATSILNHGFTNPFFVAVDRSVMCISAIIYSIHIDTLQDMRLKYILYSLVQINIILFFASKCCNVQRKNILHIILHISTVILFNLCII